MSTKKIGLILYCVFGILILIHTKSVWSILNTWNLLVEWKGEGLYDRVDCRYLLLAALFYYLPATVILLKNCGKKISMYMIGIAAVLSIAGAAFFTAKYYMLKDPMGMLFVSFTFLCVSILFPIWRKRKNNQ